MPGIVWVDNVSELIVKHHCPVSSAMKHVSLTEAHSSCGWRDDEPGQTSRLTNLQHRRSHIYRCFTIHETGQPRLR